MKNFIDTSNNSLAVGLATAIVVFFLVKYLLETHYTEEENNKVMGTSVGIAAVAALILMYMYKQILIYRGKKNMLQEGFYDNN